MLLFKLIHHAKKASCQELLPELTVLSDQIRSVFSQNPTLILSSKENCRLCTAAFSQWEVSNEN